MKNKDAERFVALATAAMTRDMAFLEAMQAHNPMPMSVEDLRGCVDAAVRTTGKKSETMFVWLGKTNKSTLRKVVGSCIGPNGHSHPQPELLPGERFYFNADNRPTVTRSPNAHP